MVIRLQKIQCLLNHLNNWPLIAQIIVHHAGNNAPKTMIVLSVKAVSQLLAEIDVLKKLRISKYFVGISGIAVMIKEDIRLHFSLTRALSPKDGEGIIVY